METYFCVKMAAYRHVSNAFLQGREMFSLTRQIATVSLHHKHTVLTKTSDNICVINHLEFSTTKFQNRGSKLRSTLSANSSVSSSDSSESLSNSSSQNFSVPFDPSLVDSLLQNMDGDLPVSDMPDPFVKDYKRCFLCNQNVNLDHKNVRLLSQFVSPYTGRIYGRAVTGLCIPMQKHVAKLIKRARTSGYMPYMLKDPKYLQDPQPYDPMAHRKVQ